MAGNMVLSRALGLAMSGGAGGGAPPIAALFNSVNADGWSADYTSPPTFNPTGSPEQFTLTRQGYVGITPTSLSENLVVTQRVRQAFPNQASLTAGQVALSDYVYSTDTIAGGKTNNSTETSPKPVANWALPDRQVVGNTVRLEVVAFHRNARAREEVAAVEFSAFDGTTTVTQVVTTSTILGHSGDQFPVIGYACDLDISTLANPATITCNAKVYPHVGASGSVLDSAGSSVAREFSPRTYRRDTTLAASPFYVYVTTGGVDATGAVSTSAATAEASPCLTIAGAFTRIQSVRGDLMGVEIRLGNGTFVLNGDGSSKTQGAGELIITRDPNISRANAIMTFGLAAARLRFNQTPTGGGWIRFRDITVTRTGTLSLQGEATSQLQATFENCAFNNASHNAGMLTQTNVYFLGTSISNTASSLLNPGTHEIRMLRGMTCPGITNYEAWLVLGCSFIGTALAPLRGSRSATGSINAYSRITGLDPTGSGYNFGFSENVAQYALCQNILEFISATTATNIRTSADSATGTNTHAIIHNNTMAGFFSNGRDNLFYEDGATPRTSKLMSCRANIHVQINTKGDVFVSNGARVGNWAYLYGVGCDAEWSQFIDADNAGLGTAFAQAFPGLRANIGTSNSVRNDPLFTAYAGTTSGPSAGAGGGNYALTAPSPCKAKVTNPPLRFDLAGATRSATAASIGAYE
jgi:hypothetical protein